MMTPALREPGAAIATAALAAALCAGLAGCASPAQHAPGGSHIAAARRTPLSPQPSASPRPPQGAFRLLPARGRGYLAPGSDPAALPGDVLIADEGNHRLLLVDPRGRIRWMFPPPSGRHAVFGPPDDAFVSPNGRSIIATQEQADTVSVIDIATERVIRRLGHPGMPGPAPGYLSHPDDAMMLPSGDLLIADIQNCRILLLSARGWHVIRQFGAPSSCGHDPPVRFSDPNGAFPMANGHFLITEINGDWAEEISLRGRAYWSVHPPGVRYPSDANEIGRDRYLVADYSYPGKIVIFDRAGHTLWRFGPTGSRALNHPSLALPLPGGNILINDDYNDRVIVVSEKTKRIVWQYGHYGIRGRAAGYLDNPDGVDLAPPDSLLMTHAAAMAHA